MDVEPVFIDQAEPHETRSQIGAADAHVLAGLHLQLLYCLGDVSPDQPGIPADMIEGLRKNDLRLALPDAGVLDLDLRCGWIVVMGKWRKTSLITSRKNLDRAAPIGPQLLLQRNVEQTNALQLAGTA